VGNESMVNHFWLEQTAQIAKEMLK